MTKSVKKSEPKCAERNSEEYQTFENALKKVLKVSHSDMQKKLTQASSARALSAKD